MEIISELNKHDHQKRKGKSNPWLDTRHNLKILKKMGGDDIQMNLGAKLTSGRHNSVQYKRPKPTKLPSDRLQA